MSTSTPPDIVAIKRRRDAVMELTFKLAAEGDRHFRMSIPLQQDDADVLLMKLCSDVDALCAALETAQHDHAIATAARDWFDTHVQGRDSYPWIPLPLTTALVADYDARHPETDHA